MYFIFYNILIKTLKWIKKDEKQLVILQVDIIVDDFIEMGVNLDNKKLRNLSLNLTIIILWNL